MKKTIAFYLFVLLLIGGIFTACEPEPVVIDSPQIALAKETGFVYGDSILNFGQGFKVKIIVAKGTNSVKLIGIKENNVQLPLKRIVDGMAANPLTLGDAANDFTREITLLPQQSGASEFLIYVEDTDGRTNAVKFTITEVINDFEGTHGNLKVFNFSGHNFGTLDLHAAVAVGENNTAGDIRDGGIDPILSVPQNWKQIIFPVNGARLFKSSTAVDFNAINTKAKLKSGTETSSNITASQKLKIGDIYFATTPSLTGSTTDYFMLKVDDIVITPGDNLDYYLFSLKQALNM